MFHLNSYDWLFWGIYEIFNDLHLSQNIFNCGKQLNVQSLLEKLKRSTQKNWFILPLQVVDFGKILASPEQVKVRDNRLVCYLAFCRRHVDKVTSYLRYAS